MKPIVLRKNEKEQLLKLAMQEFEEQLKNEVYVDSTITLDFNVKTELKEKICIIYTPKAYLRMNALVQEFSSEISWFGLVDRIDKKTFVVYDVLTFKQQVSGSKVDTDDDDQQEFYDSLTDEQSDHLHFQAHSHVNMSTVASNVDEENQKNIVRSIPGHQGYYIFQIWNKQGDINTCLYDLDENIYYDRNDVEIYVEDEEFNTLEEFVLDAKQKVTTIQPKVALSSVGGGKVCNYSDYGHKAKNWEKSDGYYRPPYYGGDYYEPI